MNRCFKYDNPIRSVSHRLLLMHLVICSFVVSVSGCAALSRSGGSKGSSATSPFDVKSLAKSQAALAVKRAEDAEQQGNPDEAIRYYEQARDFDPELEHLSRRLAVLYDQRGNDERARTAYEHALQLQPRDPDLLNDFGVFHLHREDWAAAETWFRRALAIETTHPRATNNLAMSLAMQNRLNESYEAFSRIVGPAAAYSNLGVLLTRQGRLNEARDHFQNALALDGAVHQAGEFLSWLDRSDEATISSTASPSPTVEPVSYQSQVQH